jgi:hypothetical protein
MLSIFYYVVLKSDISQNFDEIIGEIERWAEVLDKIR